MCREVRDGPSLAPVSAARRQTAQKAKATARARVREGCGQGRTRARVRVPDRVRTGVAVVQLLELGVLQRGHGRRRRCLWHHSTADPRADERRTHVLRARLRTSAGCTCWPARARARRATVGVNTGGTPARRWQAGKQAGASNAQGQRPLTSCSSPNEAYLPSITGGGGGAVPSATAVRVCVHARPHNRSGNRLAPRALRERGAKFQAPDPDPPTLPPPPHARARAHTHTHTSST